jgi:hypothetical protein
MGLAPHEQRVLTGIEQSLRRSDARLAARFATFTAMTSGSAVPRWERVSPRRLRPRRLRSLALLTAGTAAAALFMAALVFGQVGHASGTRHMTCGVAGGRQSICQPAGGPSGHAARYAGPAPAPAGPPAAAQPGR